MKHNKGERYTYKRMVVLAIVVVVLLGLAFFYFFRAEKAPSDEPVVVPPATEAKGTSSESSIDTPVGVVSSATGSPATFSVYTDPYGRFSFGVPAGFKVNTVSDGGGGEIVTVQNSTNTNEGLQIRIQKADEDIVITPERIRADIPDIALDDPQSVTLDNKGKGTMFTSDDPSFDGKSREVWFSYKRNVYQVSTYLRYDARVKEILGTWKFQ